MPLYTQFYSPTHNTLLLAVAACYLLHARDTLTFGVADISWRSLAVSTFLAAVIPHQHRYCHHQKDSTALSSSLDSPVGCPSFPGLPGFALLKTPDRQGEGAVSGGKVHGVKKGFLERDVWWNSRCGAGKFLARIRGSLAGFEFCTRDRTFCGKGGRVGVIGGGESGSQAKRPYTLKKRSPGLSAMYTNKLIR